MGVLELAWTGAVVLAAVAGFVALDWLGSRWFRALPEPVRRRGLVGLALDRLRRRRLP
jgi:hypothetical protein